MYSWPAALPSPTTTPGLTTPRTEEPAVATAGGPVDQTEVTVPNRAATKQPANLAERFRPAGGDNSAGEPPRRVLGEAEADR
jgi:hypothetical protein